MITNLRRLHPDLALDVLTPSDIRASISECRANADHVVDYERALELADANLELVMAVADYDKHCELSYGARYTFNQQKKFRRASDSSALTVVAQSLISDGVSCDGDVEEFAKWLVSEGERFHVLKREQKAMLAPNEVA